MADDGAAPQHVFVGAELAAAKSETMKAAGRSFAVVRFVITDLGRATVGG
jgi:hypothetical protein